MLEKNTKTRDFLELMETVLTIAVSLVALSGTFAAYKNGFFHRLDHVIRHYHEEALIDEKKAAAELVQVKTNTTNIAIEQQEINAEQKAVQKN